MTQLQRYQEWRTKTAAKIKEKGKPVLHRSYRQGEYDPATQTTQDTNIEQRSHAVEIDFTVEERINTSIGVSDRKLMLSTEGIKVLPIAGDEIVIDAGKSTEIRYAVRQCSPFAPGPVTIYLDVWVGR